jgi:hypothetical protein
MKNYQIIEIIGMTLVFFSVGWELFVSQTVDSIAKEIELRMLHYKLDQLHHRQYELQQHFDHRVHQLEIHQAMHGVPLSDKWNPSPHDEDFERVSRQSKKFSYVKTGLFVIGSLLLIGAKIIEYSHAG